MTLVKHSILVSAFAILAACGSLEWPPETGGVGYRGSQSDLMDGTTDAQQKQVINRMDVDRPPAERLSAPFKVETSGYNHFVVAGETLSSIAETYGSNIYEIAILNQLEPPFRIYVGQSLLLPESTGKPIQISAFRRIGVETETVRSSDATRGNSTRTAPEKLWHDNPLRVKPGIKPRVVSKRNISRKETSAGRPGLPIKRTAKMELEIALPAVQKGSAFIWPVKGKLVSRFGKKGDGLRNDGINILAPRGTTVRAARDGVIAYAGNELRGFGNLLLIKHSGGWVTAYAHNEILLVRRGQKVKRGQIVAKIGDSGNVGRPQLHFEIRKGNKAVDPIRQIGGRANRRTTNQNSSRG